MTVGISWLVSIFFSDEWEIYRGDTNARLRPISFDRSLFSPGKLLNFGCLEGYPDYFALIYKRIKGIIDSLVLNTLKKGMTQRI